MGALKQRESIDTTLSAVVAHPMRARAFMVLAETTASPIEIANRLGVDLNKVSYHVRKLETLNLIELVDTRPVRGAVEHFYRAIERPLVTTEQYAQLDQAGRNRFAREIAQLIFAGVSAAIDTEVFSSRPDNCIGRVPMLVDEEGWGELSAIYEDAILKSLDVQAASAERMAASREEGIHVEGVALLFEREMNSGK